MKKLIIKGFIYLITPPTVLIKYIKNGFNWSCPLDYIKATLEIQYNKYQHKFGLSKVYTLEELIKELNKK